MLRQIIKNKILEISLSEFVEELQVFWDMLEQAGWKCQLLSFRNQFLIIDPRINLPFAYIEIEYLSEGGILICIRYYSSERSSGLPKESCYNNAQKAFVGFNNLINDGKLYSWLKTFDGKHRTKINPIENE